MACRKSCYVIKPSEIGINTALVVIRFIVTLLVCLFLAEVIQYEHTVSGYIDELKRTFICLPLIRF